MSPAAQWRLFARRLRERKTWRSCVTDPETLEELAEVADEMAEVLKDTELREPSDDDE